MTGMNETPHELLAAVREILRRAVMTLAALRDPDRRFLGLAQMPAHVVHDVQDAYGYSSASVRDFRPSAYEIEQAEVVLPWLAWLRRAHGDIECRRFIGWSSGAPVWKLAKREKCSERTIHNRLDRSVAIMIREFCGANIPVEIVDEPYKDTAFAAIFERSPGPHERVRVLKVYVAGIGFMKGNKRLRTALETA